jgi:hypothetical protein
VALASRPALTLAFSSLTAVAVPADLLLVVRRLAVVALSNRGGTRMVLCLALAVTVVSRQCRRRASEHEKECGHENE